MTTTALQDAKPRRGASGGKFLKALGRPFVRLFGSGRWISLILLIGLVGVRGQDLAFVEFVRLKTFDVYQKLNPRLAPEKQVLIADLDEASLAEIGQWPWSRDVLGKLVGMIADGGGLVGFDMVFAEPDRLSPDAYAAANPDLDPSVSAALKSLPNTDAEFAKVIADTRAVLGFVAVEEATRGQAVPPPHAAPAAITEAGAQDPKAFLTRFPAAVANLPVLEKAAVGAGLFTVDPEFDNVVRRIPAITMIGDRYYPALSIELLRVAFGQTTIQFKSGFNGIEAVRLLGGPQGGVVIPTDNRGRLWPHYAKATPDRYISVRDIVSGKVPPETFDGKIVIFGASASGLRDIRTTPVDSAVPGVEVHAQLIESILTDSLLSRPQWVEPAEWAATAIAGIIMILGLAFVGAKWTLALFLGVVATVFGVSWYEFSAHQLMLDATAPVLTMLAVYIVSTYISFTREEASRRQIKSAFGFYLSPAMVDKLASNPNALVLGGEMREMTIFFSDMRGFSTISEMFDAEGLTRFMNRYLTPMTDIAQKYGAYIDKYIGDAIMAFWNAPLDDPEHAQNACRSILEMRTRLVDLNAELKAEAEANGTRYIPIGIGMGANSGPCVVGNMGSEQKFNYSVLGDAVNLASRLEGQSKPYHLDNIIGESTRELAPEFAAVEVDLIQVKGKTVPARVFTLVGDEAMAKSAQFQSLAAVHERLLVEYRSQQWDKAEASIVEILPLVQGTSIAGLYETYRERMAEYLENPPPPDWDGVYVATSK